MWEINCDSYRGQKQNFEKKVKIYFRNFQNFYWPKTFPGTP